MKRIIIVFLCVLFLIGCLDRGIDKRNIKVINKSNSIIYCLMSETDSLRNPYINYRESIFNEHYIVNKDSSYQIYDKPPKWETFISYCEGSKMRLFIISKDSINKYGWKKVLMKTIYTKVYKLDMNDLINSNWQVIYFDK